MHLRRRSWVLLAMVAFAAGIISVPLLRRDPAIDRRLQQELERAIDAAKVRDGAGDVTAINMTQVQSVMERELQNEGTNSLPVLVRWIEDCDQALPAVKHLAARAGETLHIRWLPFWEWATDGQRHQRAYIASKTIDSFGSDADPAIPRLRQIARGSSAGSQYAVEALRSLGEKP